MKKIKLFSILSMLTLVLSPINIQAEENEELVCYYIENCKGELELVCVDPNAPAPCQIGCPPGCGKGS